LRFYIAGGSNHDYLEPQFKKAKYVLESYVYIKPWQLEIKHLWKSFMLDSGAFTLMQQKKKGVKNDINWREFAVEYSEFINKHEIDLFFELDLDHVIGLKETEKLRKIIELRTGKQPIPVFHKGTRDKEYFKAMTKDYPYVAIGGLVGKIIAQKGFKYLPWFTDTAHENGAKIHGLGFTPMNILDYNFDSVDSTSWLGCKFGNIYSLNNEGGITTHSAPKGKRTVNYKIVDKHNLGVWMAWQHILDRGVVE